MHTYYYIYYTVCDWVFVCVGVWGNVANNMQYGKYIYK